MLSERGSYESAGERLVAFVRKHDIKALNVACSRGSKEPGVAAIVGISDAHKKASATGGLSLVVVEPHGDGLAQGQFGAQHLALNRIAYQRFLAVAVTRPPPTFLSSFKRLRESMLHVVLFFCLSPKFE